MEEGSGRVTHRLRLAFMGTPDFAVPSLTALIAAGHEIAAVYTQPPRPAGRGQKQRPSPVQQKAEALGLPVRHPSGLRGADEQQAFADLELDAAVVAAYGLILPLPILSAPRYGCINVHASLLPRWRGAAPIHRAILAGDTETGVTIMMMAEGLDTGDMLTWRSVPITPETTTPGLHDRLAALGAHLLPGALDGLVSGTLTPTPQPDDGVTYAAKISRTEGQIDWSSAEYADRQVRALSPFPGAWFAHAGETIKLKKVERLPAVTRGRPGEILDDVLTVACGDGQALRLLTLQRPGRSPTDAAAFLRGYPGDLSPGTVLGAPAENDTP
ncbi:methionyl-tRNA formyltransferase [Fodinicurvata sp. EGI_FJ10296]|uniref:methionyl-tRNA formyltransferase n=1 Tax=Fodinicurvata sp. EGI_FJ10296 TaxID=3231908 RepID=UPI003455BF2D